MERFRPTAEVCGCRVSHQTLPTAACGVFEPVLTEQAASGFSAQLMRCLDFIEARPDLFELPPVNGVQSMWIPRVRVSVSPLAKKGANSTSAASSNAIADSPAVKPLLKLEADAAAAAQRLTAVKFVASLRRAASEHAEICRQLDLLDEEITRRTLQYEQSHQRIHREHLLWLRANAKLVGLPPVTPAPADSSEEEIVRRPARRRGRPAKRASPAELKSEAAAPMSPAAPQLKYECPPMSSHSVLRVERLEKERQEILELTAQAQALASKLDPLMELRLRELVCFIARVAHKEKVSLPPEALCCSIQPHPSLLRLPPASAYTTQKGGRKSATAAAAEEKAAAASSIAMQNDYSQQDSASYVTRVSSSTADDEVQPGVET